MISQTAIHAVRAIIVLAEANEGVYLGAVSIAKKIKAPKNYLGKLLQNLSYVGLVESQKGLGGGFRLARDPQTISLHEIVDPIDHLSQQYGCILGRETCSEDTPCPLHAKWVRVRDSYIGFLKETSVSDIVQDESKYTPLFE